MAFLISIGIGIGAFMGIVVCILGVMLLFRLAMIPGLRALGIGVRFALAFHFLKRRMRHELISDEREVREAFSAATETMRYDIAYAFIVGPPCVGFAAAWYLFCRGSSHCHIVHWLSVLTVLFITVHAIWRSERRRPDDGRTYVFNTFYSSV